jgi:hypothetical protein
MNPLLSMLMGGSCGASDGGGPLMSYLMGNQNGNGGGLLNGIGPSNNQTQPGQEAIGMGEKQLGQVQNQLSAPQPQTGVAGLPAVQNDQKSQFGAAYNQMVDMGQFGAGFAPGRMAAMSRWPQQENLNDGMVLPPKDGAPNQPLALPPPGSADGGGFSPIGADGQALPNPGVAPSDPGQTPWGNLFGMRGTGANPNVLLKGAMGYNMGGLVGALGAMLTDFNANSPQNQFDQNQSIYLNKQRIQQNRSQY